jgi:hypothetical protein
MDSIITAKNMPKKTSARNSPAQGLFTLGVALKIVKTTCFAFKSCAGHVL